jgi:hypothetical protein
VSNSGGIKLSTCQSLGLKTRGHVDDRFGGVPHVARFAQQRFEHQRDRQIDWTQPGDGAEVSEFASPSFSQVPPLTQKRSRKPSKLDEHREYIIARLKEFPLSASCIYREIQNRGFSGKYTIVKDFVREVRPIIGVPAIYCFRQLNFDPSI